MLLQVLIFAVKRLFSVKIKKYRSISKILIDPDFWLPLTDAPTLSLRSPRPSKNVHHMTDDRLSSSVRLGRNEMQPYVVKQSSVETATCFSQVVRQFTHCRRQCNEKANHLCDSLFVWLPLTDSSDFDRLTLTDQDSGANLFAYERRRLQLAIASCSSVHALSETVQRKSEPLM